MIVFTEQREKVTLWLAVSREAGERVTRRREALDIQVRPGFGLAGGRPVGSSLVLPGSVGNIPMVGSLQTEAPLCGPYPLQELFAEGVTVIGF